MYFCLVYYWHAGIKTHDTVQVGGDEIPSSWCCSTNRLKTLYVAFCSIYVPLTIIKLGCAWAIAWVTVSNTPAHQILAGGAFGSAVFIEVLLFARRLVLHGLHGGAAKAHLGYFYYFLNGVVVLSLIGLAITFCVIRTGEYEFTIMLLVVLGPLFQIYDFLLEPDLTGRYFHKTGLRGAHPIVVVVSAPTPYKKSGGSSWLQRLFTKKKVG